MTKKRDKATALKFLHKLMRRHRRPEELVTDKRRSYAAALKALDGEDRQVTKRRASDRAETSHQPFRRCDRATLRFGWMHGSRRFASAHASVHNHLNADRSLTSRPHYKQARAAALNEWQALCGG